MRSFWRLLAIACAIALLFGAFGYFLHILARSKPTNDPPPVDPELLALQTQAWSSVGIFIATSLGIALLAWTLLETRRATAAAKEAVTVTRRTGQDQVRAYAIIRSVEFRPYYDQGVCIIEILNTGQTPIVASSAGVWVEVGSIHTQAAWFTTEEANLSDEPLLIRPLADGLPIPPDRKECGEIHIPFPFYSDADALWYAHYDAFPSKAAVEGLPYTRIRGQLFYEDVFGREHSIVFEREVQQSLRCVRDKSVDHLEMTEVTQGSVAD